MASGTMSKLSQITPMSISVFDIQFSQSLRWNTICMHIWNVCVPFCSFAFRLGFVHPLQDVALHQCLPCLLSVAFLFHLSPRLCSSTAGCSPPSMSSMSSVCCFPDPGGSLLACYAVLQSVLPLHWCHQQTHCFFCTHKIRLLQSLLAGLPDNNWINFSKYKIMLLA